MASARKTTSSTPRPPPWYREPLVWMVLAVPATAVIMGAVMLVLASATWDGLVAGDYYRRGMQINRSLARDAEATRRGLEAAVSFPAPGIVRVRLTGPDGAQGAAGEGRGQEGRHEGGGAHLDGAQGAAGGVRLELRFARAARAGADVMVAMTPEAGGGWWGRLPTLPPGKWYVELGNEEWRLAAPVRMPVPAGELVLRAASAPAGEQGLRFDVPAAGAGRRGGLPLSGETARALR